MVQIMGKIYDVIKKQLAEDEIPYINQEYIGFHYFILCLKEFTDEPYSVIGSYLLNDDDFLKLDYYYNKSGYDEDSIYFAYYYDGVSKDEQRKDDKQFWEEDQTATETFLNEVENTDYESEPESDPYDNYHWLVSDLIQLESLQKIGINQDFFDRYLDYGFDENFNEMLVQNEDLLKRIDMLRSQSPDVEIQILLNENRELLRVINEKELVISTLQKKIDSKRQIEFDEELHPRTAKNASKIIAALAEMAKIDITKHYGVESNGEIIKTLELLGETPPSKDTVAEWLKKAHKIIK